MTTNHVFTLAGPIDSALTHFAGLGLAAIVADRAGVRPRIRWTAELDSRYQLTTGNLSEHDVAAVVLDHAVDSSGSGSWVQKSIDHEGRSDVGLFSPRIKAPLSSESWRRLHSARGAALSTLETNDRHLDLAMIAGLGEPAYWRFDRDEPRPDHGASRWEMKTRNQGQEFVGNRLSALATTLAKRNMAGVLDGLTGKSVVDELGGRPDSQTSTGLQRPGPVDSALAWCALWGLSAFPVVHDAHGPSRTPCSFPRHVQHSTVAVLPVVEKWMTVSAFRFLLVSSWLDVAASAVALTDGAVDELSVLAARSWLKEHGVRGFVRFPILKTGSASAPQRIILDGVPEPVESVFTRIEAE